MKTCNQCDEVKSEQCFYNYSHEHKCKSCLKKNRKLTYEKESEKIRQRVRKYCTENPEKIKGTKLKQDFGVTLEWYKAKLEEQKGVCAICQKPEKSIRKGKLLALAVDHSHETGKVRSLLCMACNRGVGLLNDNVETLQAAIDYLNKYKK